MDKPIFRIEYGGATTTRIGEVDITEFPPGAKITEYASEAFSWAPYAQYQHPKPRDEIKTMTELCQYNYLDFTSEDIDPLTGLCPDNCVPSLSQNYWRWWIREHSIELHTGIITLYKYLERISHRYRTGSVRCALCDYICEYEDCVLDDEDIINVFGELI